MVEALLGYIAACEENIVRYREMGDERAVASAEGMIRDFKAQLEKYNV